MYLEHLLYQEFFSLILVATCDEPSAHTCKLTHIGLNKANIGDKGLDILIKNLNILSSLSLIGNDIHSFGVSCLADAVCSGKLRLQQLNALHLSDNPLGLEGSMAVSRIISSSHWQSLLGLFVQL